MPYKNKEKDRVWHKLVMRARRLRLKSTIVTPPITPTVPISGVDEVYQSLSLERKRANTVVLKLDADGNIIPEMEG